MGTGIIGGAAASLVVPGDPLSPLQLKNATFQPGQGMAAHIAAGTPGSLVVDSVFNEAPQDFGLTLPGAASALTLALWRNNFRNRAVFVRKLEAYFRTQQTTSDVANYYRVKAVGSGGGQALLPLTAVTHSFLLDQGFGAVIDQGLTSFSGLGFGGAFGNVVGVCNKFTVSQVQTITGLVISQGLWVDFAGSGGVAVMTHPQPVRVSILDSVGNILGSCFLSAPASTGNTAPLTGLFTEAVTLAAGGTFFLAFDLFTGYTTLTGANAGTNYVKIGMGISDTQSSAPNPGAFNMISTVGQSGFQVTIPSFSGLPSQAQRQADVQSLTWPNIIAGNAVPAWLSVSNSGPNGRNYAWQALGSPSGLALVSGDITFSIDTVGTPLATALGSDLVMHAVLSPF